MPAQITPITSRDDFAENCYIVRRPGETSCLVVDPGYQHAAILKYLADEQLTAAVILNTHGHCDHIAGNFALKVAFPDAPLVIGRGDAVMLSEPARNLSLFLGEPITSPEADELLDEGQPYSVGGFDFEIREIPGHSPGHIVFINRQDKSTWVLGGDVLFAGGIGRFDFPGGNGRQLVQGIFDKLLTLPDETVVYPGHGPETTVGEERQSNPFLQRRG